MDQEARTVLEVGGKKEAYGVHKQISLYDIFEEGFIESVDKDVSGWVFGECKNNHRSKKDLLYLTELVYDIDKADRDIYDELKKAFKKANIHALLHTTHSHDPEKDKHRLRAIVSVDGKIPVADYKGFYEYVLKKIPFLDENRQWLDDSGKALSRFFYKPSYHPDREQYKRMSVIGETEPVSFKEYEDYVLDVKEEEEKFLGEDKKQIKLNGKHRKIIQDEDKEKEFRYNLFTYFDADCEEEEWRDTIWSLKSLVTHHGWDEEWVKNLLIEWSKTSDKHTWDEAEEHFYSLWERDVEDITIGSFFHNLKLKSNFKSLPFIDANEFTYDQYDKDFLDNVKEILEKDPELKKSLKDKERKIKPQEFFQLICENFYFLKGKGKQFVLSKQDIEDFRIGKIKDLPQYLDGNNKKLEVIRVMSDLLGRSVTEYETEINRQFKFWEQNANYSKAKTLIGFYPTNDNPDVINLFPKEFKTVYNGDDKEVRSILDHDFEFPDIHELIFKCLCNSDKQDYEYLIKWIALRIQNPAKKPLTVLIFLGTKGTGKDTFGLILKELFGHIVDAVSNMEMILQKHNQILINLFIVICNEANFIFNPQHMGRFKTYITDSTIDVEPKNLPPYTMPSFHGFIIFSNNAKVMHEDKDGRRSVYFKTVKYDPKDDKRNKEFYARFYNDENKLSDKILEQMVEFRGYLDRVDITNYDPSDRPESLQYAEQKLESLQGLEKWLFHIADTGKIKLFEEKGQYLPLFEKSFFTTQQIKATLDSLNKSKHYQPISDKGLAKQFREFLEDDQAEPERKMIDHGYQKVKRMGWYIESISDLRARFIKRYHLGDDHRWTISNEKLAEIHEDLKDKTTEEITEDWAIK